MDWDRDTPLTFYPCPEWRVFQFVVFCFRDGSRLLMDKYIYSHNSPSTPASPGPEHGSATRRNVNMPTPPAWFWKARSDSALSQVERGGVRAGIEPYCRQLHTTPQISANHPVRLSTTSFPASSGPKSPQIILNQTNSNLM